MWFGRLFYYNSGWIFLHKHIWGLFGPSYQPRLGVWEGNTKKRAGMWLPAIRRFPWSGQTLSGMVLSSWGTIWDAFVIWWNNNIQENDPTNCCSISFVRHFLLKSQDSKHSRITFEMSLDSSQNPPGVLALTVIDLHSAIIFFSHSYQPTGTFRWVLLYTNTRTCVCVSSSTVRVCYHTFVSMHSSIHQ